MTVTLKRIDAVVLFVADLERAKQFYRDTLGLGIKFEDPDSVALDFGNTLLILLTIAGAQDLLSNDAVALPHPPGASSQLVAFAEDVHAAYPELTARGGELVRGPTDREGGPRMAD